MKVQGHDLPYVWSYGDYMLEPFTLKAGVPLRVELEWNFTNEAHAKDWSLVAHGTERPGTLHLTHDRGLKSDFWGHIKRQDPPQAS